MQGTSVTEPVEDACSKVFWFSILGAVIFLIHLLFIWIAAVNAWPN